MNPFRRKAELAQSVVLDTSGIIDGRIVQIAQAGFVPQNIVVPQFVIAELQFLADHGDTHKRERARYGLDVVRELQDIRRVDVSISREKFEHIREVDDKLVALAKQYGALLYTTDFNLNKVAQIEGVRVLNVNELAHALRPNLLPGERVSIKLTQVGQDKTQGVGYLSDGTMVVVEQAGRYIGQQVQATCTRILQTQAGKMMFATLVSTPAAPKTPDTQRVEQKHQHTSEPQYTSHGQVAHITPMRSNNRHRHTNSGQGGRPEQRPESAKQVPKPPQVQQQKRQSQAAQSPQRPIRSPQQKTGPGKRSSQPARSQSSTPPKRRLSPEDSLLATIKEIET